MTFVADLTFLYKQKDINIISHAYLFSFGPGFQFLNVHLTIHVLFCKPPHMFLGNCSAMNLMINRKTLEISSDFQVGRHLCGKY